MNSDTLNNIKQLLLWKKEYDAFNYLKRSQPEMKLKEANNIIFEIKEELEVEKQNFINNMSLESLGIPMLTKEEYLPSKKKSYNEEHFGLKLDSSEEEE